MLSDVLTTARKLVWSNVAKAPVIHKRFSLLIGLNNIVLYDVSKSPHFVGPKYNTVNDFDFANKKKNQHFFQFVKS